MIKHSPDIQVKKLKLKKKKKLTNEKSRAKVNKIKEKAEVCYICLE